VSSRIVKLLILFLGIALLLYISYFLMAPKLINKAELLGKIDRHAMSLTGKRLIMGNVDIDIMSGGTVVIDGIAIRNEDNANATYFLKANRLIVKIDMWKAVKDRQIVIKSIEVVSPKIELERFSDGRYNWAFLQQGHEGSGMTLDGIEMIITDGMVSFTERATEYTNEVKAINGSMSFHQSQVSADLNGINNDIGYHFSGLCSLQRFMHIGDFDSECSLAMSGGIGSVNYSGRIIAAQNHLRHKGMIKVNASDGRALLEFLNSEQPKPQGRQPMKVKREVATFKGKNLPVIMDLESYSDETQWIVNVNSLQAAGSNGKGTFSYRFGDMLPHTNVDIWFEKLDMDELLGDAENDGMLSNRTFAAEDGFTKTMTADFAFKVKNLLYRGGQIENVVAGGQMAEGEIVLTDAKALLPGKGSFIALGRFAGSKLGVDFTGQVEAHGSEFVKLMPMMGIGDERIPKDMLGTYRARFNIIKRPESTTISELRLLLQEKVQVSGGINIYAKGKQLLDATIAMRYIDLDPYLTAWRAGTTLLVAPEKQPNHPFGFQWLRDLDRQITLTLDLQDYRLIGLDGEFAKLSVQVSDHEMSVKGIDMKLDTSRIQGKASVAVQERSPRPVIKAQLMLTRLNLDEAFMKAMQLAEGEEKFDGNIWSREPLDLSPLHYFDGEAELRIRQVDHKKFRLFNFRTLAKLDEYRLHLQEAKMSIWGGDAEADVVVDSSVVPGLTISFSASNYQLREMLQSFVDYRNLSGTMSLSGKINFSGVNFQNWLDRMNGSVAIDGRNVLVQSFNLPAIVRAVDAVRSVSGLSNSIRLAMDEGSSWVGNINGTVYFADGNIKTTKVSFRTNESVGELEGAIDLERWTMDMAVKFGLNSLAQVNYPVFIVNFTGPINQPEYSLNTKSVEAYIARKAH